MQLGIASTNRHNEKILTLIQITLCTLSTSGTRVYLQNTNFDGDAGWLVYSNLFIGGAWQQSVGTYSGPASPYQIDDLVSDSGEGHVFSFWDDGVSDKIEHYLLQEFGAGPVGTMTESVFSTGDVIVFRGRARATRSGGDTSDMRVRAFIRVLGYNELGWSSQVLEEYTVRHDLGPNLEPFDLRMTFPDLAVDDSPQVLQVGFEITAAFDGMVMDSGTIYFEDIVGYIEGDEEIGPISNVRVQQRAGTGLVDIYYDLSGSLGPTSVAISASSDGGQTYLVPVSSLSGDVGSGIVEPGLNRHIVWDAVADIPNFQSDSMVLRVEFPTSPLLSSDDLIAYEGFEYPENTALEYRNGGKGWATGWTWRKTFDGSGSEILNSAYIEIGGLTYGRLESRGNHLRMYGDLGNLEMGRQLASVIPGAAGTSTYISFIGQRVGAAADPSDPIYDNPATARVEAYPYGSNLYPRGTSVRFFSDSNERLLEIGNNSNQSLDEWSLIAKGTRPGGISFSLRPVFVVVKIDHAGDETVADDITMWIDPKVGQVEGESTAQLEIVSATDLSDPQSIVDFSNISWVSPWAGGGDALRPWAELLVDELRIGRTWSSVTPTDELSADSDVFSINTVSQSISADDIANGSIDGLGAHLAGSTVTLTAIPDDGYIFVGWSGDISGGNPTTVTLDADKSVGADFITVQNFNNIAAYGRLLGVADVLADPRAYDLLSSEMIESGLRLGGIRIEDAGGSKLVSFDLETSADLISWDLQERIEREFTIPSGGSLFIRVAAPDSQGSAND